MRYLSLLFALCLSAMLGAVSFVNPILPYDYSDPDVCRVGDKYLMTSSSFNNVPGLQILESSDLVHWTLVDAALPYRLPGYEEGDALLGNFVWAPAIREHDGLLYIYYGDPDRGIYCVRGQIGAWEEPVLVMPHKGYIDPCPLWDEDGRCYLSHGVAGSRFGLKSVLMMAELSPDGLSVKTPSRIIFDGHEQHPTCEGTKLYKRDGYYYLMHPAGGVKTGWQVVQRSRSIYGPYELRVTLAQGKTAINGPHQGAYVETPAGEGWFYHFQDVGAAGRIVHLQPVRWLDGWPIMGNDGEPVSAWSLPLLGKGCPQGREGAFRDDFSSPTLGWDWQFAGGQVNPRWFFCDAQQSRLRLYSYPKSEELMENMLLQKIPYAAFTATARVRFLPNTSVKPEVQTELAEQAGMIVFGRESFMLRAEPGEWMYLRVEMDAQQRGCFYTSRDGKTWLRSGEPFQAVAGKWIGAQVGFFCTRTSRPINDSGYMDVDWFEIRLSE